MLEGVSSGSGRQRLWIYEVGRARREQVSVAVDQSTAASTR